ncbi:MAG TPA: aminopeptidase [Blastocatellia bacterium]|nr:aminopeptidase [Blastocatellia bacterium]
MSSQFPVNNLIELAKEGARKVLTDCVDLKPGDVLALFWDETTSDTAEVLLEIANEIGLNIRPRRVSLKEQSDFSSNKGLSLEDKEALESARGIITCLSNQVSGTAYRTELLRVGTDGDKCFGHMPGANLSVLAHAVNIDYAQASSRCDDLALALTLGQVVRLQTYILDSDANPKQEFNLDFQIGGLFRSPIMSTGIIPLGTWGNLPGGETFIAPIEDSANGVFVLNGAFKDYVIKPPAYLLLHFEKGRLVDIEGTAEERARFENIVNFALSYNDTYYDSLAELGIGVNPGIQELTGNALFDEKCYGTAHIAIGDNSRYGGMYSSRIHEDLITLKPSLWVDGKPILSYGQDNFNPKEWRESLDDFLHYYHSLSPDCLVTRTIINAEADADGKLRVRREVAAGRLCLYTIAQPETSRLLAKVYLNMIPNLPDPVRLHHIYEQAKSDLGLSQEFTEAAVGILQKHGLINIKPYKDGAD